MARSRKGLHFFIILIIIAILGVASFFGIQFTNKKFVYKTAYMEFVQKSSKDYNVDIYLIFSVIKVESSFREKVFSNVGAVGLMQIMPETARYIQRDKNIDVNYLLNPEKNIDTGVKYLAYLMDKFNGLDWVLSAYNAGETKVKGWIKEGLNIETIPYKETRDYVKKVNYAIKRYKDLYYFY